MMIIVFDDRIINSTKSLNMSIKVSIYASDSQETKRVGTP